MEKNIEKLVHMLNIKIASKKALIYGRNDEPGSSDKLLHDIMDVVNKEWVNFLEELLEECNIPLKNKKE